MKFANSIHTFATIIIRRKLYLGKIINGF